MMFGMNFGKIAVSPLLLVIRRCLWVGIRVSTGRERPRPAGRPLPLVAPAPYLQLASMASGLGQKTIEPWANLGPERNLE
jgi:hypothetical protein